MTSVQKKVNGSLRTSGMKKYHNVIRLQFINKKKSESWLNHVYNTKTIEYMYWDDPNELVRRLKLLIASYEAGKNSHQNEIVSVINELKEARIIRDGGSKYELWKVWIWGQLNMDSIMNENMRFKYDDFVPTGRI